MARRTLSCGHPIECKVEDLCYWCEDISDLKFEIEKVEKYVTTLERECVLETHRANQIVKALHEIRTKGEVLTPLEDK